MDCPPGTGDEPLSAIQTLGDAEGAIVVTTGQDVAVADVRRCVTFCKKLDLPVLGVIENMAGFVCPKCGDFIDFYSGNGGEKIANEFGVPMWGRIGMHPDIVRSGDLGKPFVEMASDTAEGKVFNKVFENLIDDKGKKMEILKLAVPCNDGELSQHFGHCEKFAIISADKNIKMILKTDFLTPPGHEPGVLPKWLSEQGVDIIIAGGMGQRAQQLFKEAGVDVLVGAPVDAAEKIVQSYLDGNLVCGINVCDH